MQGQKNRPSVYNAHGDVVQLTDSAGTATKDYTYDAFGVEKSASETDTNPFRYCGEQYDGETGNYYLRARYYAPGVGRFTQEDPAMDGLNWYVYCYSNPVLYCDPSGNKALKPYFPKVNLFPTSAFNAIGTVKAIKTRLNYEYNKQFHVTGYINGQEIGEVAKYRYGLFTMDYNGCEIIANYNALIALGNPQSLNDVANWGENHGQILGGLFGTLPISSKMLFEHLGYKVKRVLDSSKYDEEAAKADACIFTYLWWDAKSINTGVHTVYVKVSENIFDVYNEYNKRQYASPEGSFSEWIARESMIPLVLYCIYKQEG